jgi:hypothetical protein
MNRHPPARVESGGALTVAAERSGSPGTSERVRLARALIQFAMGEIETAVGEVWPEEPVRVGDATTGGRTVFCRVRVGAGLTVRATYSLLGTSIAALARDGEGGLPAVREAQAAYVASGAGASDREAEQLDLLYHYSTVGVHTPIAVRGGVLLTPWVDGANLGRQLLARPDLTQETLTGIFAELADLHSGPAVPLVRAGRAGTVRAAPAVLARASGGGPDPWLADGLAAGWTDHPDGPLEIRRLGLRLVARLGRLTRRLDPHILTGAGVSFGGVSPTRVLYPPGSSRPVFVSPDLGPGGHVVDAGVLLGRMHLLLAAARHGVEVAGPLLDGVEGWLYRQVTGQGGAGRGWLAAVLILAAAETVSTLAVSLALPPGVLPLSPGAVAATRRALDLLTAVDAYTSVLVARGPDAAMTAALTGMHPTR